jgi:catechol 2,3-dioxygenase-like lactoylglutathione lyase family enzyme
MGATKQTVRAVSLGDGMANLPADKARDHTGVKEEGDMIQTSGIDHLVLHVRDVAHAKKFYTELLGMTVYRENTGQVFLHCGQQGVALFEKRGDTPLTTGNDLNHLALNVETGTYEALKAELERHGVTVSGRPGETRCIYFHDPDGHRLQLMVRS